MHNMKGMTTKNMRGALMKQLDVEVSPPSNDYQTINWEKGFFPFRQNRDENYPCQDLLTIKDT